MSPVDHSYSQGGLINQPLYDPARFASPEQPRTRTLSPLTASLLAQSLERAVHKTTAAFSKWRTEPDWSDDVEPGSHYVKHNNTIKKEGGVKLRMSITSDMSLGRPKASKIICRVHGAKYMLDRDLLTWKCPSCDAGKVVFSRWYKDTYSLGYLTVKSFSGDWHKNSHQEVVLSVDENFNPIALMIQRGEEKGGPVFVTDLGKIAVDLALRSLPDSDGVRHFDLSALYGVSQNSDEETVPEPQIDSGYDMNKVFP